MVKALRPTCTSAPTTTPVSVAEAKSHLRLDHSDHDTLLGTLIDVATAKLDGVDGILGRAIITQTWKAEFDEFPGSNTRLYLPLAPVASVTSVKYYDGDNAQQTLSAALYTVLRDHWGPFIEPVYGESWPDTYTRPDAVEVIFVGGEATAPKPIKQAILMMVEDLYRITKTSDIVPTTVSKTSLDIEMLLSSYRRQWACSQPV